MKKINTLSASRECPAQSPYQPRDPGSPCLFYDSALSRRVRDTLWLALPVALLLIVALLPAWSLPPTYPQVVLQDSTPGTDDIALYIPLPPEDSLGPASSQSAQLANLSDTSYVLAIGSDYSFPPNDNKEFFTAYLRAPGASKWLAYSVIATIPRAFSDKEVIVSVRIDGIPTPVTGKVPIKFHNNSVPPFSVDPSNTGDLDFTKSNIPTVLLKNNGASFPVTITQVQVLHSKCTKCWRTVDQGQPVSISPGSTEEAPIPLRANTTHAIYESLLNFAPIDDDNLELMVSYSVLGTQQTAPIHAPVHFIPSIADLLVAILVGGLLGYGFARLLEPDKFSFPIRALAVAIGTALVVEMVAMLLGTKLQVLGAELDPKRFLPAFLLALLVAGGPKVPELIKTAIDRLRGA